MNDSKAYWIWDRELASLVELLADNLIEDEEFDEKKTHFA
jgi:hypothetical protein